MTNAREPAKVWIFHGAGAHFASGVFTSRDHGLAWIARHRLTGILTEYPVGDGCYDIALRQGHFSPHEPQSWVTGTRRRFLAQPHRSRTRPGRSNRRPLWGVLI